MEAIFQKRREHIEKRVESLNNKLNNLEIGFDDVDNPIDKERLRFEIIETKDEIKTLFIEYEYVLEKISYVEFRKYKVNELIVLNNKLLSSMEKQRDLNSKADLKTQIENKITNIKEQIKKYIEELSVLNAQK